MVSSRDLRTYFLVSNSIVLKFEIRSADTVKQLEYFYDENVLRSYDECWPIKHGKNATDHGVNQKNNTFTESSPL